MCISILCSPKRVRFLRLRRVSSRFLSCLHRANIPFFLQSLYTHTFWQEFWQSAPVRYCIEMDSSIAVTFLRMGGIPVPVLLLFFSCREKLWQKSRMENLAEKQLSRMLYFDVCWRICPVGCRIQKKSGQHPDPFLVACLRHRKSFFPSPKEGGVNILNLESNFT